MAKIIKNRSDAEMMVGYKETATFENTIQEEEPVTQNRAAAKNAKPDLASSFFTPELQEKIGKLLLEIKLELYKEGIVDYNLKVSREGQRILLTPVPAKPKTK